MTDDEDTPPRFQKLELQVERFRIQLERIVSDIESEKRTRSESTGELRQSIARMGEKFESALKEATVGYKEALRELANDYKTAFHEMSEDSSEFEEKIEGHLKEQDKFQYKVMGALVATQVILAFLAPWLYKHVFSV